MTAISNFLKLLLIATKIHLKKLKEAKRNEIKNDPLDHFDHKFGSLHNDKDLSSSSDKQNTKRDTTNIK